MKRRALFTILAALSASYCAAQDSVKVSEAQPQPQSNQPWYKNVTLQGFTMMGLTTTRQDGSSSSSFNINLARLAVSGEVDAKSAGPFFWKAQLQINGNVTSLGSSARMTDFFVEWRKYEFARVTVGEFSLPFTIESPFHPLDVGFSDNAQSVLKLVGYSDRSGQRSSNGRDLGIMVEGDFLHASDGHPIFHYGISVVNGQGLNTKDLDGRKNIVGQIFVSPIAPLRIGFSGWDGTFCREGEWTDEKGQTYTGLVSLAQHRYAISADWNKGGLTARVEYIHSTGYGFSQQDDGHTTDVSLKESGNKADGAYALVMVPIFKNSLPGKMRVKARYDLYRPAAEMSSSKSISNLAADYWFTPKIGLAVEYGHVNDRTLARHNYNYYDFEVQLRF